MAEHTKIFINNKFVNSVSGKTFPTYNPSTGNEICQIQEGDKADVDAAVKAARAAFKTWRDIPGASRAKMMNKLADLVDANADKMADLEVLDNGKPKKAALGDMATFTSLLRYYSGWCDKINGKVIPSTGPFLTYTRHEPIGVVGAIIPWNFPMAIVGFKLGPALAVGCTIIIKPAEFTSLTALQMCSFIEEAGFPPGVINVVPGYGPTAGAALSHHMDVNKIAFTGSTVVGRLIQKAAAETNLKRVSLELGGKSPHIVFDDAGDLDQLAKEAVDACYVNSGQTCCAGTRTFVQEGIYDEFVKKCTAYAKSLKVGDPTKPDTDHGPQINERQLEKIQNYIKSGKEEGAKLECGGKKLGEKGYFIEPTVFSGVTDNMKIAREEIFGPVQSILKFKTIDEVIERSNKSHYGLAGAVFTTDIEKAIKVTNELESGTVWINCNLAVNLMAPFGGYKESGYGRELGEYGLENYTQVKSVIMKTGKSDTGLFG